MPEKVKMSVDKEGIEALDQGKQGKPEPGLNEVCFAFIFGSVLFCIFGGRLISLFLVKTVLMNTALAGSP